MKDCELILVLDTVSINIRTPGIYFDYLGYIGLKGKFS